MSCLYVWLFVFATFQGYPGEDNKTPGPPGPLGEPVGLAFLQTLRSDPKRSSLCLLPAI